MHLSLATILLLSSGIPLFSGLILAQKSNNIFFNKRFQLSQTRLLITRGFYAEAKEILQKIEPKEEPRDYQFLYYYTMYGLYNNWSTYCENNEFSKNYDLKKVEENENEECAAG